MTPGNKADAVIDAKTRTFFIDQTIKNKARCLARLEPTLKHQLWRSFLDGRSTGKAKRMMTFRQKTERQLIDLLKARYRSN